MPVRRPLSPPLFPYTTLFRSDVAADARRVGRRWVDGEYEAGCVCHLHCAARDDTRATVDRRHRFDAPCEDRKSTRLNSSHQITSYAVICLKKKNSTS